MRILSIVLFVISTSQVLAEEKGISQVYRIDSTTLENNLSLQESSFSFYFYNAACSKGTTIIYSINGKQDEVTLDGKCHFDVKSTPGNYKFIFYYNDNYFEVYTDSIQGRPKHKTHVSVFLQSSETQIMVDKPVLYFYPKELTNISVKIKPKGEFTFTYPEYNNGWFFTADQKGNLKVGNEEFNYLFWESNQTINLNKTDFSNGQIIEKQSTLSFLDSTLNTLGFTSKEKADFITYWGPQLIKNERNFIQFIFNEKCNDFAELEINPTPNNILRIYMLTFPLKIGEVLTCQPQNFQKMERSGFTVLEWGGFVINKPELPN